VGGCDEEREKVSLTILHFLSTFLPPNLFPYACIVSRFPVKQRSVLRQFYSINDNQNMQIMRSLNEINTGK
jgi:hypothetical protein